MKNILILAALLLASGAHAQSQPYSFNPASLKALQEQVMASPAAQQAQQAVMQQALQQAAANPQLLTQMAGSLSPQQQSTLLQQALTIGQKIFTPAEQAKLTAFAATPEGSGIMAKLPQLAQQMAPVVLQMYAAQSGAVAPAAGK